MASRVEIENYILANPNLTTWMYAKHFEMQESVLKIMLKKSHHDVQECIKVINAKAGVKREEKTKVNYDKVINISLNDLLAKTNEPELLQEKANFMSGKQRSFMWFEDKKEYIVEDK